MLNSGFIQDRFGDADLEGSPTRSSTTSSPQLVHLANMAKVQDDHIQHSDMTFQKIYAKLETHEEQLEDLTRKVKYSKSVGAVTTVCLRVLHSCRIYCQACRTW